MRYARSRREVSELCFRGPGNRPEHTITPNAGGWFDVLSGRSGEVHRVSTEGKCTCTGYGYYGRCSHVKAVLEYAATRRWEDA